MRLRPCNGAGHRAGVQVRQLRSDDWPRYREIRLAALADAPGAFGSTLAREQALTDADWQERARSAAAGEVRTAFVAEEDGAWVGLVGGYVTDGPPADVEMVSLWVAPHARGRGVGNQLVDAVVRWACDRGARVLGLWVTEGNRRAIGLYERRGFVATADRQPLPSDPDRLEMHMVRVLTPAAAGRGTSDPAGRSTRRSRQAGAGSASG